MDLPESEDEFRKQLKEICEGEKNSWDLKRISDGTYVSFVMGLEPAIRGLITIFIVIEQLIVELSKTSKI